MSTIKAINLTHPSAATGITMDTSGNATVAGSMVASSSYAWRNRVINGDMRIDQRNNGAAISVTAQGFPVDRFYISANASGVISGQRSTVVPAGFTNSTILTVTTPRTSIAAGDVYGFRQAIEGFNTSDFGWGAAGAQTVTLSFWVRSSITGTYAVTLFNGAFARSYVATYTISAANTWEQKSITIPGDTSGTWATDNSAGVTVYWDLGSGSSFNGTGNAWNAGGFVRTSGTTNWISTNGATFYLTGAQLEVGTVATPFERRDYGRELILCQRYFEKTLGIDCRGTGTLWRVPYFWKVVKRASPTVSLFGQDGVTPNVITQDGTNRAAYMVTQNADMCSAESNALAAGAVALTCIFVGSAEL